MVQGSKGLQYSLSVASISQHLFEVSLEIPALNQQQITLTLPSWIPGSYMVRDFARNIITINACTTQGEPLQIDAVDKQTWRIDSNNQPLKVQYTVYAYDLSVRSAYINDEYAFFNGTSVFLAVKGYEHLACDLTLSLPAFCENWSIETSMTKLSTGLYHADNYDEFIDHPVFLGRCTTADFVVENVNFKLLFSGETAYDMNRLCRDLEKVCRHHLLMFGQPAPVDNYLFMTLIADKGYGGLEHRSSTALLYPRFDLPLEGEREELTEGYVNFISLCSHELFHTWHVKRIKPDVMVTPDLSQEVYTDQLWIYEGFTSYYDDVTLARTGIIPPERYAIIVAQNLTRLLKNTGRFKQSIAESSFYAWTKFYKQDASAGNNIVSYYNKGGLVALGLDLLIRAHTANKFSLDDLMRALWAQYGQCNGTPASVITELCLQLFDLDVSEYLNQVVYGTEDVPLDDLLTTVGIEIHTQKPASFQDKGGDIATAAPQYQFGAIARDSESGIIIQTVQERSAADCAGLQIDDKIIGADNYVVNLGLLQRMLSVPREHPVVLTVIRDGRIINLELPMLPAPTQSAVLKITDQDKVLDWLNDWKSSSN